MDWLRAAGLVAAFIVILLFVLVALFVLGYNSPLR